MGKAFTGLVLSFLVMTNSYAIEHGVIIKTADLAEVSQTLTILGDGSGAVGETCVMGNWPPNGATDCTCILRFRYPNGEMVELRVPTVDHGRNLLRCSYAGVDVYVKWFDVRIVHEPSNLQSNTLHVHVR